MADTNIRITLGGRGGGGGSGGGRRAKVSAKLTHQMNKNQSQSSMDVGKTYQKVVSGISKTASFLSGNEGALASAFSSIPMLGYVYGAAKLVEKTLTFGSQYREARTGESMLESNYRARLKTGVMLGTNILAGEIRQKLFVQPQIIRQNASIQYDREIYNYTAYSGKINPR